MGLFGQRVIAAAAVCGLLYLLDDVRQYWGAVEAPGVVSAIEARESCREGETITLCRNSTHVMVAYADHGVDRVSHVSFDPIGSFFSGRGRLRNRIHPSVGLQVPVVVVNAKPHLTRLAAYHRESRQLMWLQCLLLAALIGFAWNGKLRSRSWNRFGQKD